MPPTWRLFFAAILLAVGLGDPAYGQDPAPNARALRRRDPLPAVRRRLDQ